MLITTRVVIDMNDIIDFQNNVAMGAGEAVKKALSALKHGVWQRRDGREI